MEYVSPSPNNIPPPHKFINCNLTNCNKCYQCKMRELDIEMVISNNRESNKELKYLMKYNLLIGISYIITTPTENVSFYSNHTNKIARGFKDATQLINCLS